MFLLYYENPKDRLPQWKPVFCLTTALILAQSAYGHRRFNKNPYLRLKFTTMETNKELELARKLIEQTGTHLFLTGKAGTGKTTFLHTLKENSPKRMVVLAPTGIAAINAGGMTIHSFFQLPFAPFVPGAAFGDKKAKYRFQFNQEKRKIMRSIDLLVIDEISMVRADLLDAIDDVLRRFRNPYKPFGGVQLLLIGDVQQLPPVIKNEDWQLLSPYYDSPYFFSSHALRQSTYCTIELQTVYRQKDREFLDLLNAVRENRCDARVLDCLNRHYRPDADSGEMEGYIRLTTHNQQARQINAQRLEAIKSESICFQASITGSFPEYSYPTDVELELKEGAQVMFIKNDTSGKHRYANGTIGKITRLDEDDIRVRIEETGTEVEVKPEEWTNAKYRLDKDTKEIVEDIEGTFTQYPLKLAWAITVHKSQGLTFEHAVIDVSSAFAHGQTYVALSRCRSLEGLVLTAPVSAKSVISDWVVRTFNEQVSRNPVDERQYESLRNTFYLELLKELFGFQMLERFLNGFLRLMDEYLYELYPRLVKQYKEEAERFGEKVVDTGVKFERQCAMLISASADCATDSHLQQRIHDASEYFLREIHPLSELVEGTNVETDNKELFRKLDAAFSDLSETLRQKTALLEYVREKGFAVTDYLRKKSLLSLDEKEKQSQPKKEQPKKESIGQDIQHPKLYNALTEWRRKEAQRTGKPAYTVLHQKALLGIANLMPTDEAALLNVPHVGKKTVEKYGDTLLSIIEEYKENEA